MQRLVLISQRFSHPTILPLRCNVGVSESLKRNVIGVQTYYGTPSTSTIRGRVLAYSEAKLYSSVSSSNSKEVDEKRKRVVVLGTGWGAINFLKDLKNTSFDVQIVSTQNYFALNPLLPCVACGTLQAGSVAEPIRNVIRKMWCLTYYFTRQSYQVSPLGSIRRSLPIITWKDVNMYFCEAECTKIDSKTRKVHCTSSGKVNEKEFIIDYDYLVIAVGAQSNTFSIPGVPENCHFLKNVEDAQEIRRKIIDCFEKASLPNHNEEMRKQILHFVVVGGGPTGVELAGQLYDFIHKDLARLYPDVKGLARVTLLEAGDHILNMFHKKVRAFVERKFQRNQIDLKTGKMVVEVSNAEIFVKESKTGEVTSIPYGMIIWSTGIATRPVIKDFIKEIGQSNGNAVTTDEWLKVPGADGVYAFGDCATISQRKIMDDVSAVFHRTHKDKSGTLSDKEFQEILKDICERYPQAKLYFKAKKIHSLIDLIKKSAGVAQQNTGDIDLEEFKLALSEVDSHIKKLPPTGQVYCLLVI
ncbi:hypothetical protein Leryth_022947 [Lithospermum erythrorhizon]|nr:hypothetical protein Leryth_022947 [Lithospermum erythrorhizon]